MDHVEGAYKLENSSRPPPSPVDFDAFYPYAFTTLDIPKTVTITRINQVAYVPFGEQGKVPKKSSKVAGDTDENEKQLDSASGSKDNNQRHTQNIEDIEWLHVTSVYDPTNNLVQLQFVDNPDIPRAAFQILGLIVKYHAHLSSILIKRGLNKGILYELNKAVLLSKITDVILDDNFFPESNYYILINENSPLRYLSLSRCKLNDSALEEIISRLQKSSICILNISSNRITDVGAGYIGQALRTNRQLSYLNLAGNRISDIGAESILDPLLAFTVNENEIYEKRKSRFAYLKTKRELVAKLMMEVIYEETDKKEQGKKDKKSKLQPVAQANSVAAPVVDAEVAAESILGPYMGPFREGEIYHENGELYCYGNNTLQYLSLAYNHLSFITVKKLLKVLLYQGTLSRTPNGLVNLNIEGNNIPENCTELREISRIIETGLSLARRNSAISAKKKVDKKK